MLVFELFFVSCVQLCAVLWMCVKVCVLCVTLVHTYLSIYLYILVADRYFNGRPRLCSLDVAVFVFGSSVFGGLGEEFSCPSLLVDCSWLLLRWLAVLMTLHSLQSGCLSASALNGPKRWSWETCGHLFSLSVLPWGTVFARSRPSSTLWAGLLLGGVSFRQKGFWPLGREMRTPGLHSLGRGLWGIPQRVVRRGVGPAVCHGSVAPVALVCVTCAMQRVPVHCPSAGQSPSSSPLWNVQWCSA